MYLKSHIIDLLQKIGLTYSEAKFYLNVYQKPNSTLKDLQKKSKLSQSTIYRAFEHLKELGFITSSPVNWRKNIAALPLKVISEKVLKEERKLKKIAIELQKLENLMSLSPNNEIENPIRILTNKNQLIEHCYQMIEKPWDYLLSYGSAERLIEILGQKPEHDFVTLRTRYGKSCNCIFTEVGDYAKELLPNAERYLRYMKVQLNEFQQNYMMYIYNQEMTIWEKNEDIGSRAVIISDPNIVKMHEYSFNTIWNYV